MKQIPLTRGYFALIDDDDYARVLCYRWSAHGKGKSVYARSTHRIDGKQVLLHRFIMNALTDSRGIDHKNRNGLDCRKTNLRFASQSQNRTNSETTNSSGFKGIYRKGRLWFARIGDSHLRMGGFENAEDAARIYDTAARAKYGDFARLNFPDVKDSSVILLRENAVQPRRDKSGKGIECRNVKTIRS